MRFLVDQQLPPALCDWLRRSGHEAVHTEFAGLGQATDAEIWVQAQLRDAVVVTKDADFAAMRRHRDGPQVLWLRIGNASRAETIAHVESHWRRIVAFLEAGEAIVEA